MITFQRFASILCDCVFYFVQHIFRSFSGGSHPSMATMGPYGIPRVAGVQKNAPFQNLLEEYAKKQWDDTVVREDPVVGFLKIQYSFFLKDITATVHVHRLMLLK